VRSKPRAWCRSRGRVAVSFGLDISLSLANIIFPPLRWEIGPSSLQRRGKDRITPFQMCLKNFKSFFFFVCYESKADRSTRSQSIQAQASLKQKFESAKVVAPVVLTNLVMTMPAHAEAGKLFDFNLTLPIIAAEFLTLMFILDKTMFGPVGKALDDRDELIRSQLAAVGGNTEEVDKLIAEKDQIIGDARAQVGRDVAALKTEMDAKIAAEAARAKADVDRQIADAMRAIDAERESSKAQVESQGQAIADQIVAKVVEV
jgi:F-type H+-transporting ATPase subunit b